MTPVIGSIVGIDPGSTTLGLGLIRLDMHTLQIIDTNAKTLRLDKHGHFPFMEGIHEDRFRRLYGLEVELLQEFRNSLPFIVASESPFYNRLRPNAYGVLVECIDSIRKALFQYYPYMPLELIDPPTVKKALGASGNAKKEEVALALGRLSGLNLLTPLALLDEHSVDAIGVAYGAYKRYIGALQ